MTERDHIEVVREATGCKHHAPGPCGENTSIDCSLKDCHWMDAHAIESLVAALEAERACYRGALERIAGNPGPIVYEGQLVKDYDTDWFRPIVDAALTKETP